jgi:hypothetical protein
MLDRLEFAEMWSSGGPRAVLIYCSDYRCSHSVVMDGYRWSDDVGHPRGPSKTWVKSKNPESAAVRREREEEWQGSVG